MNFIKKTWNKFKELFKQGLTPKQLSLSITVAIVVSLFPIFGISTIVLTALAVRYKLNLPIMIALSYVVEPIKALLFIPFINIGETLFGTAHTLLTFEAIKASYDLNFWNTLSSLSYELLCGFVGWGLTILPASIFFYFLLKEMLKYFVKDSKSTK
ncbi:DUF2062 domain-containing protein [Maribacter aquivivus]|uniref:DUF2062 domain-containing protein n=1 Tax=Maribacter aquivivus TaxID=228958 RepID=A0A1M6S3V2_9FLAO|nr:DUF2062 domain-containing protein [Maribacter aquivivus]SHK39492.1 hypothetical protein SAMN04488007_2945 [Maribacter aquivivus]